MQEILEQFPKENTLYVTKIITEKTMNNKSKAKNNSIDVWKVYIAM